MRAIGAIGALVIACMASLEWYATVRYHDALTFVLAAFLTRMAARDWVALWRLP